MLSVHLICVGKLKEKFYLAACAEYQKRLGAYCKLEPVSYTHLDVYKRQVPHGVVGGDVADALQLPGGEPLVGVVVVEIGHPLPGPAAELAHVVGGSRGGDEGQVHLHPRPGQSPGGGHGDVVDPGNVAQGCLLYTS